LQRIAFCGLNATKAMSVKPDPPIKRLGTPNQKAKKK